MDNLKIPVFTDRFSSILSIMAEMDCGVVVSALLNITRSNDNPNDIFFVDIGSEGQLTYYKVGKPFLNSDGTFNESVKRSSRVNRVIRMILKDYMSNEDYNFLKDNHFEKFANTFSSARRVSEKGFSDLTLIRGDAITRFYDCESYHIDEGDSLHCEECGDDLEDCCCGSCQRPVNDNACGTLWNSCMRYSGQSDFFEVYERYAEMLVLLENGKVRARALVWTTEDGSKCLDRVYYTKDDEEELFKMYAIFNKWNYVVDGNIHHYDAVDNSYSTRYSYGPHNRVSVDMSFIEEYPEMPYMDTFYYLVISEYRDPYLTISSGDIINENDGVTLLQSTEGEVDYDYPN